MDNSRFEEQEFDSKFNGRTVLRIIGLARSHWVLLAGFLTLVLISSTTEAFFPYLVKLIIDRGVIVEVGPFSIGRSWSM